MRRFLQNIICILCVVLCARVAHACETNEIDVFGDGTNCETAKFTITTTNLSADTEFRFYMSATGTFYVDWGDGTVDTITRNDTTETLYNHTFISAGVKTIRFGGLASGYNSGDVAAIRFGKTDNSASANTSATISLLNSVSGSLSQLFPVFGGASNQNPKFCYTFYYCNNLVSIPETLFSDYTQIKTSFNRTFAYSGLTSIPAGLFSHITEAVGQMFFYTFNGCYGITSIPAELFSGITRITGNSVFYGTFRGVNITSIPGNLFDKITTARKHMFYVTFADCSRLTSIPTGLFKNITTAEEEMFLGTFYNCKSLTFIPRNLFSSIHEPAKGLFYQTFYNCTSLTSIPDDLFVNITGAANDLFSYTFADCTSLTSIPENLFGGITGAAYNMFGNTFKGCTSLTSIPEKLFSGVTGASNNMFAYTFRNCSGLSGYIPASTFSGLIANTNHPSTNNMWLDIFSGTSIATTCPAGTVQYITGYEDYWDGHVSCVDENLVCGAGKYLPAHGYECKPCLENNYCVGGTYPYSESNTSGITPCPTGYSSSVGASACEPNTITINWDGAESGTCTYGGTITTPTTPPTRRGYTFVGWMFE